MTIYFTDKELACEGTGITWLAEGFGDKLDELRHAYGKPMKVNSACRSMKHNAAINGHPNSAHVYDHPAREFRGSYAIDIHCVDGHLRLRMVQCGIALGWSVGVNKTFIHFDRRTDYFPDMKPALFTY